MAGGNLIKAHYLKGEYRKVRGSFFTRNHMDKARGNRYKLHKEKFYLNRRKTFLQFFTGTTCPGM